jgi:hypothetical protein
VSHRLTQSIFEQAGEDNEIDMRIIDMGDSLVLSAPQCNQYRDENSQGQRDWRRSASVFDIGKFRSPYLLNSMKK